MVITCKDGWSWLLTTRAFIGNADSKTSKVEADEAKQYQDLNLGARTSGNVITFAEGKQLTLKTWSDYYQKFKLDTFKMNSGSVVDGVIFSA
jgi:hypothetical protein